MLTKVSEPNCLTTSNIINWCKLNSNKYCVEKIQDNLEGYLLIKLNNNPKTILFNYYLNKYYSYNLIQIHWGDKIILKHIDSFDQNNWMVGNRLRNLVFNKINHINQFEFKIDSILGIGGEYYLYWIGLNYVQKLIGISNHSTIVTDANTNIPWSFNYLVDYNKLNTYPKITNYIDLILINLSQLNSNIIKYICDLKFKKIILIICNLPDSKLKLLAKNFKLIQIKYFKNYNNIIRVIEMKNILYEI
jgi:hypothetical protein